MVDCLWEINKNFERERETYISISDSNFVRSVNVIADLFRGDRSRRPHVYLVSSFVSYID